MDSSQITLYVISGILFILIAYLIMIYNNLVALKRNVGKNWSNIEVLLKQRNSEIPKLVNTCQEYMQYEKETLTNITNARSDAMKAQDANDLTSLGSAETNLRLGLGKLFALAENYPDLKANDSFQQLQNRISNLENSISDRRELYNESVNINNVRIEQFPDILVAKAFSFKHFKLLKFSENETQDVNVKDLFR